MKTDKEKLDAYLELQEYFEDKAFEIENKIKEIEGENQLKSSYVSYERMELTNNEDYVALVYTVGACGHYEEERFYFPVEYLYNDNWEQELKQEIEKKRLRKKQKEEKKRIKAQKAKEKRDRAEYMRLKMKAKEKGWE